MSSFNYNITFSRVSHNSLWINFLVLVFCHNKASEAGRLEQQKNSSGEWKSKIKGLLSSKGLSLWLVGGGLLPVSSQGLPSVSVCVLISSHKDTDPWIGPTQVTSFQITSLKTQFKCSHILRYQELKLHQTNLEGTPFSP